MIRVRCVGHIKSSIGSEEVELDLPEVSASELLENLRKRSGSDPRLGFTKYNTIVIINDGEAFTAAADDRLIHDGDTVVLLPFSHGG